MPEYPLIISVILRGAFQIRTVPRPPGKTACRPRPIAISFPRACKIRRRDWHPEYCYRRHMTRPASFFVSCVRLHLNGGIGRGRRKTRRFPVTPVMPTPPGSTTREIGISGGENITRYRRLPMATILIQTFPSPPALHRGTTVKAAQ